MDNKAILERMRAYFEGKEPADVLASFSRQSPKALLHESLDVVDFILYLEEALGCEIDVSEMGEALLNKDFGELAAEAARRWRSRGEERPMTEGPEVG